MAVKARRYDMSNRARHATETRRRIAEAAARLFVQDGYGATTINAIAAEAGVAVPTVYATLKTKQAILWAVIELTARGDADQAPLAERQWWREMERERDPRETLAKLARIHREICDREAAVFTVLETAANVDPEVAPVMRQKEQARYSDQSRVVRSLKRQGQLRAGLSVRKASDIIWALATERSYLALVRDRGWRAEDYEDWLSEQLAAALLPR
jgi:TetR/AcrR family transcriptional regulator, regulator of autoinduction and epiphytic fitness